MSKCDRLDEKGDELIIAKMKRCQMNIEEPSTSMDKKLLEYSDDQVYSDKKLLNGKLLYLGLPRVMNILRWGSHVMGNPSAI